MLARFCCHKQYNSLSGICCSLLTAYRESSGIGIKVRYSRPYYKVNPLNTLVCAPILTLYCWPSKLLQYDMPISSTDIKFEQSESLLSF